MDVNRQQGDLGGQTVERIRAVMQVDEEWSFDIPGGFAWWGAGLRQRIWSERVQAPDAPSSGAAPDRHHRSR